MHLRQKKVKSLKSVQKYSQILKDLKKRNSKKTNLYFLGVLSQVSRYEIFIEVIAQEEFSTPGPIFNSVSFLGSDIEIFAKFLSNFRQIFDQLSALVPFSIRPFFLSSGIGLIDVSKAKARNVDFHFRQERCIIQSERDKKEQRPKIFFVPDSTSFFYSIINTFPEKESIF